jgi:hypothetical protein
VDDAVEAFMNAAEEHENAPDDPEKGSEEASLEHAEEPSNNSFQGAVAEGLEQDVDMQGSNAPNIVAPSDGTGSSTTSLAGNVVNEHGTAPTSMNLSMAQAIDNSEKATSQSCTLAPVAQATRVETPLTIRFPRVIKVFGSHIISSHHECSHKWVPEANA